MASHILHFLHACFTHQANWPALCSGDLAWCAGRLVREVAAHRHHLQVRCLLCASCCLPLLALCARHIPAAHLLAHKSYTS